MMKTLLLENARKVFKIVVALLFISSTPEWLFILTEGWWAPRVLASAMLGFTWWFAWRLGVVSSNWIPGLVIIVTFTNYLPQAYDLEGDFILVSSRATEDLVEVEDRSGSHLVHRSPLYSHTVHHRQCTFARGVSRVTPPSGGYTTHRGSNWLASVLPAGTRNSPASAQRS
jgi:hypothetical protein